MADKKKISSEETEIDNNKEKKVDSLDSLLFSDDEDYDETSDEVEFDTFMAEYRELINQQIASSTTEPADVEEEKPEEVLITLPKKQSQKKKDASESKDANPDWDEKITLEPEEYEDPIDEDTDVLTEASSIAETDDVDLGEEGDVADDSFQLSIHFDGDRLDKTSDEDDESSICKYDPEKPRVMDWVFDIAEMFVFVLVAVILITSFFFKHSVVDGPSMMNTLYHEDHLIISDLFYTPERGDIVVFEDYSTSLKKAVIKRVIGLPGETVEVRLNENKEIVVYINGELLPEDYTYNAKDTNVDPNTLNRPVTVGENEIFVMGDNRYHSADSRYESVGPINIDTILGKVIIRFYPFDRFGVVE